ncbi:hypothetical protein I352_03838 [Cryptococcus deuterogattii MMRL2647]|nr:hypothetical protein I352_03838 [Cryptococcus deuterogattii MMRL2647]
MPLQGTTIPFPTITLTNMTTNTSTMSVSTICYRNAKTRPRTANSMLLPTNVLDHAKLFPLDNVKYPSLWRLKLCSIQDLRQPISLLDPSTRITTISLVLWRCGILQQVKRAMVKREEC